MRKNTKPALRLAAIHDELGQRSEQLKGSHVTHGI